MSTNINIARLAAVALWPLLAAPATTPVDDTTDATTQTSTDGWPTYRGNPSRTGVATSAGPLGEPTVLWEFQTDGPIRPEPAVVDGTVYIGSDDGHLYALDAATGSERWSFAAADAVASSPAVVDGTVYVGSSDGTLYALDAADGSEQWSFPGARDDASVAVVDGVVYAGSNEGTLYALDAAIGTELWSYPLGESSSRSTTVADGVVYVGSAGSRLHAVDAATGKARWNLVLGNGTIGTPIVAGGTVYEGVFGGDEPRLYALDAATGEVQWEFASDTGDNVWPPTVAGDTLYAVSDDSNIYAIDAATGDELWRVATGGPINAGATLAGDIVYSASHDENLYAIDTTTGTELWHLPIGGRAEHGPAVVDGVAYLGTDSGTIIAITGSDGTAIDTTLTEDSSSPTEPSAQTAAAPSTGNQLSDQDDNSRFAGLWTGPVTEPGNQEYTVRLTLEVIDGHVSGSVDYPELSCGGRVEFVDLVDDVLRLREQITYGDCIPTGDVRITLTSANSAQWEYDNPPIASAPLTHQDLAEPPSTSPPGSIHG